MTQSTLEQGGGIPEKEWGDSHWVKRSIAVMSCLLLVVVLAVAFTRVVAVRVPEQRATLEKLITDRTGLEIRFDNVHFAWDLDGTSAVFTHVELTDPSRGRVRVVAPELRVELDTWDFLRHSRFSFGHVTLKSPDIEITGDAEEVVGKVAPDARGRKTTAAGAARDEEASLLRRYLAWAELMPTGRIEVEGARVHLLRRGDRTARHTFTLSQAVVSRGSRTFSAYGTMLLAQDVGQSLFVSAKLEGLGAGGSASGDMRVIARRVFLHKLDLPGLGGRGTLDARLTLRNGHVDVASWQASARDLDFGADGPRFDHVSVNGKLARDADEVLLDFSDLQLTRGARLERAPSLNARVKLDAGSLRITSGSARAERLPFMAGQLIAGMLATRPDHAMPEMPAGWAATAGELRSVRFQSDPWSLEARVSGLELERRTAGYTRLSQLAARVHMNARELTLKFDPSVEAALRESPDAARPLTLSGELALLAATPGEWRFDAFSVSSGPGSAVVTGLWRPGAERVAPLEVKIHAVDKAFFDDTWQVLAADRPRPKGIPDVEAGTITEGRLTLLPAADGSVDWNRSAGKLDLVELATAGADLPRLSAGQGSVQFARGGTRLSLDGGALEDLAIRAARIDWPRDGGPRLRATLEGELSSPVLRPVLVSQGLDELRGKVMLEAEARGERELQQPDSWRLAARVSEASMPLGGGLPAIENLSGTIRYAAQQLRAMTLNGEWLGGPVAIETRRAGTRGAAGFIFNGVADAAPLLRLLGQPRAAERVSGQFSWTGAAQSVAGDGSWQLSLASNLAGVESRLPEPFDKPRARAIPIAAELTASREGIRQYQVNGREWAVNGEVRAGLTTSKFEIQGVNGELRRPARQDQATELRLDQLDAQRGHLVLAAVAALLPDGGDVSITIDDARYADRSLGPLHASMSRAEDNLSFAFESPAVAIHQLSGRGQCGSDGRCRADFSADTPQLAALLRGVKLPGEWPAAKLHAAGSLDWPVDAQHDLARALAGRFDLRTESADSEHLLVARATLAEGQIVLTDVQGTGPEPDQVFRGQGRIGLVARDYDLTVDYERVALAATAVPSPARARLARAWNAMRGSVARRGWTDPPEARRVQWAGTWD